jgi:RNA polymerase sigma-70 factor (ECF subfamily)
MQNINRHTAFNSLFNRYYAGLCAYCESFTCDKYAAEDLVQDVFVNVWMKQSELNFDETISSYLYKAVHNACIQFLRHERVKDRYNTLVQAKLAEAEYTPFDWVIIDVDPAEETEIQTLYRQALEQLSPQTHKIFLCSREKGMKYSEIAELTGLSVKSVEYHISKALDVFRKALKDYL